MSSDGSDGVGGSDNASSRSTDSRNTSNDSLSDIGKSIDQAVDGLADAISDVLGGLADAAGLKRLVVSTYQAVSGSGGAGLAEVAQGAGHGGVGLGAALGGRLGRHGDHHRADQGQRSEDHQHRQPRQEDLLHDVSTSARAAQEAAASMASLVQVSCFSSGCSTVWTL